MQLILEQPSSQESISMRLSRQQLSDNACTCPKNTIGFLKTYKRILVGLLVVFIVIFIGTMVHPGGEDFSKFTYPQEIANFDRFINEIDSRNEQAKRSVPTNLTNIIRDVINSTLSAQNGKKIVPYSQFSNLEFTIDPKNDCAISFGNDNNNQSWSAPITVIIVVKSAVNNYINRNTIRQTWAINERVNLFKFKTVFIVGACDKINPVPKALYKQNSGVWTPVDCQRAIDNEAQEHGDLVQSSGLDSYYNLTIKTAMMLRWVSSYCPSDFFLVLDDDYAFEVTNLIKYIENLALNSSQNNPLSTNSSVDTRDALKRLAQEHLYAGYLRNDSTPFRAPFHKFWISYEEYPFNRYPPFITGGQVLMTHKTVRHLHLASHFTRTIKFEDVYMGIMAYKLGLKARHDDNFMCLPRDYLADKRTHPNATRCMGVHEIKSADLIDLWNHRRLL